MIYKKRFSVENKKIGYEWVKKNYKEVKEKIIEEKIKTEKIKPYRKKKIKSYFDLESFGSKGKKQWPESMRQLGGRERLKELVRIRDKHTCRMCGKIWKPGMRKFDTHHLDENIEGKLGLKWENCLDINSMITLCHRCHLRIPSVSKKMGRRKLD